MIRPVSTGDVGLDVLLGGGWRLVGRLPDRESATVLVRGGPGAGKSLVGVHAALELARALGGDVVVGCIEILPSEYVAQFRSARADAGAPSISALPETPAGSPAVLCGLLADLDPSSPDLVGAAESLMSEVAALGRKPAALVIDSLIEGYGIGSSAGRPNVDAVMKYAAKTGCALVLCEEVGGADPSPWVFAADTVLELGVDARARGRWLEVRKHRFARSASGRHELHFSGCGRPEVFPEPSAWVTRGTQDVLAVHGWESRTGTEMAQLYMHEKISNVLSGRSMKGDFALVRSHRQGIARTLAIGLLPQPARGHRDVVFELDPLLVGGSRAGSDALQDVYYVPTVDGAARALSVLVGRVADSVGASRPPVRRILLGDVGVVLHGPDELAWVEAFRVFGGLVIKSGWGIPVIAYDGRDSPGGAILATHADVQIDATRPGGESGASMVIVSQRWDRSISMVDMGHIENAPLPEELRALDGLAPIQRDSSGAS